MNALFDMHWQRPDFLLAMFGVLPVMAVLLYISYRQRLAARKEWGKEELIERFTKPFSKTREFIKATLWSASLALIIVSAAGPILTDSPQVVREGSMQLIAVVDVSPSMAAEDYRNVMPPKEILDGEGNVVERVPSNQVVGAYGSRLDMAKYVIRTQLMPTLERNKIGIVNYTGSDNNGNAFVQADLTDGYEAVRWLMSKQMNINQAPGGGSDYAAGLRTALSMFKDEPPSNQKKVILLFTDGGFTGSQEDLAKVLAEIRENDIKVIVVGLGSTSPVEIPMYSSEGQVVGYYKDKDGKVVQTAIDEGALQTLKDQTGGDYVRLDPSNPPELKIQWANALGNTKTERHDDPIFQIPLGAAIFLMVSLLLFGLYRGRKA